jgi:membrane peptidoglycan carboxypeptidase
MRVWLADEGHALVQHPVVHDRVIRVSRGEKHLHLREGEDYGFSVALGSADVTLAELVNAYRALANGGEWSELTLRPRDKKQSSKGSLAKEAAFIVSDILSDRGARAATFGLENPISTSYWSAVKTGTSKDMRDIWCVGYSNPTDPGKGYGSFPPHCLSCAGYDRRHRPGHPGRTSGAVLRSSA